MTTRLDPRLGLGLEHFVVSTFFLSLSPLLPAMARAFGSPIGKIGFVTTAYAAGFAVSTLLTALRSDRWPAIRLILFAGLLHAFAMTAVALAVTLPQLVAGYAAAGIAAGVLQPTVYRLALEMAPSGERGKWVGALTSGWSLAVVLGSPFIAWATPIVGWRPIIATLACLWLPLFLVLRPLLRAPGRQIQEQLTAIPASPQLLIYLATILSGAGFHGTFPLVGTAFATLNPASELPSGMIFLSFGVGALAAGALLGRLHVEPEKAYPAVAALASPIVACLPFALESDPASVCVMAAWGFLQMLGFSVLVLALARHSEANLGLAMGLSGASMMLGGTIGSIAGVSLHTIAGIDLLCVMGAGFTLLSGWPVVRLQAHWQSGRGASGPATPEG